MTTRHQLSLFPDPVSPVIGYQLPVPISERSEQPLPLSVAPVLSRRLYVAQPADADLLRAVREKRFARHKYSGDRYRVVQIKAGPFGVSVGGLFEPLADIWEVCWDE